MTSSRWMLKMSRGLSSITMKSGKIRKRMRNLTIGSKNSKMRSMRLLIHTVIYVHLIVIDLEISKMNATHKNELQTL